MYLAGILAIKQALLKIYLFLADTKVKTELALTA